MVGGVHPFHYQIHPTPSWFVADLQDEGQETVAGWYCCGYECESGRWGGGLD